MNQNQPSTLPIKHDLTLAYIASLVIALIMAGVSIAGILYQSTVYPYKLAMSFVANDWVNLIIGLSILLISMGLARRGSLMGLLFWPGALFYVLYTYIGYVSGLPFSVLFLAHLVLVSMSAYTLIGVLVSIDSDIVRQRFSNSIPARVSGGVMAGIAILLVLRMVAFNVTALTSGAPVDTSTLATWVMDFIECPALLIGGIMLWRREPLGYVAGAGMLFQFAVLSVGVIPIMLFQSYTSASPVDGAGIAVVSVFAVIPAVLLAFFIRGAKVVAK